MKGLDGKRFQVYWVAQQNQWKMTEPNVCFGLYGLTLLYSCLHLLVPLILVSRHREKC